MTAEENEGRSEDEKRPANPPPPATEEKPPVSPNEEKVGGDPTGKSKPPSAKRKNLFNQWRERRKIIREEWRKEKPSDRTIARFSVGTFIVAIIGSVIAYYVFIETQNQVFEAKIQTGIAQQQLRSSDSTDSINIGLLKVQIAAETVL